MAESPETKPECPVVGIGASAGGLHAFQFFLDGLPPDPGMAFVLVQHLSPDHKSILTDLVRHHTAMRVFEVTDGMRVEPNCVYVIPPSRDMALFDGALHLLEPSSPRGLRLPIDFFFRSMADDRREKAIGVILSGTGSDGSLGVRAIKGAGGMAAAQDPESAEHDGMPRSAIATGAVDFTLEPGKLAAQVVAFVKHTAGRGPRPDAAHAPRLEDAFKKIIILLRVQTSHDFSQYKHSTIVRRVERRMALHQIEQMDEYVNYLRNSSGEVEALFRDLLIGVTNFFRDPEAFQELQTQAINAILAKKAVGDSVRVWIPACSTGEEAYSIAMLFHERIEELHQSFKVQIFATDIDRNAIVHARAGIYPASIQADVTPERMSRFFARDPATGGYRIEKRIRDLLTFSEQDLIRHPPFSKLDLISCRNVLIYLDGDLQKKLIPLFDYALNPEGFLFLGSSETVGDYGDLFATLDRKWKLYQRRKEDGYGAGRAGIGKLLRRPPPNDMFRVSGPIPAENKVSLRQVTERALMEQYGAVGALVDERGGILYLHGRTGSYLEPAPGEAGMNILKMAREGLRRELTRALQQAALKKEIIRQEGIRIKKSDGFTNLNLAVRPVPQGPELTGEPRLFLVIFEETPLVDEAAKVVVEGAGNQEAMEADARLAALHQELREKESALQTALEEMETSNEELRSSHEELQSGTEELQSTNEELETSKEELQSLNEELVTVNTELQQKVLDLSRANNDMNNLLAATGIGTIFVDHQLLIQRFTPAITQVINLIRTDVGRPVGHILSNLMGYDRLVEDVKSVVDHLVPIEVEVQTKAGAWYLLRIQPYRTLENVIEGAVISFFNITDLEAARTRRRDTNVHAHLHNEALRHLVWACRTDRTCDYAGPQWMDYTGLQEAAHLGLFWLKQVHAEDLDELVRIWDEGAKTGVVFEIMFRMRRRDGVYRRFYARVEPQVGDDARVSRWFVVAKDVEDERRDETTTRESETKWQALFESMPLGIIFQDRQGKIFDANGAAERIWGLSAGKMRGNDMASLPVATFDEANAAFPADQQPAMRALQTGQPCTSVMGIQPAEGAEIAWLQVNSIPQFRAGEVAPFQVYSIFDKIAPARAETVKGEGA